MSQKLADEARALLAQGDPDAALAALQNAVRADPASAPLRIFLFQLLCVQGDWKRAITQLKLCAELDAAALPMAQTYREAIICEVFRDKVFSGQTAPLLMGEPADWVALMIEALKAEAEGDHAAAAEMRSRAFDAAPASAGRLDGQPFDWIADADMRLGPILEIIIDGKYFWLPFDSIAALNLEPPEDLRDAVWTPAQLNLVNGGQKVALIPTRYPGTAASGDGAQRLSQRTDWVEGPGGTWLGVGQRLLATDQGEVPLMQARRLEIGKGGGPAVYAPEAGMVADGGAPGGNG